MEHKPFVELQSVADLSPMQSGAPLSREARLARWIEALERDPERKLRPLHEIEFMAPSARRAVRADNSPLTVAYEDPVLRAAGLKSDQLGDGMDFFSLRERDAHTALCSCHLGSSFAASHAAARIKAATNRPPIFRENSLLGRVISAVSRVFR